MNNDKLKGTVKEVEGKVKSTYGKATDDAQTEIEGKAEEVAGKVQKSYGDAKDKVK